MQLLTQFAEIGLTVSLLFSTEIAYISIAILNGLHL